MSLLEFIQMILRNKKWVLYFPLLVALFVLFLTRNLPHTYSSETVIYTGIASGFNTDNDFDGKLDFHAANSRFDNLINIISSKETRKEVGLHLLAFMLENDSAREAMLRENKNEKLAALLSPDFVSKYKEINFDATLDSLRAELNSGTSSSIYKIIYGDSPSPFNIKTLADLHAVRLNSSDMLKIDFTSNDPLTCKKTLDFATEIFLKKYQEVRIGEADVALKYFMEQTNAAKARLQLSEETLKRFRSNNGVINYYEQTKYVADQKDDIEKNATRLRMDLEGYTTALAKVEQKLDKHALLQLQNDKILKTRNQLAVEFQKNGLRMVKTGDTDVNSKSIDELKDELKKDVEVLYQVNNTTEGLPGKDLLNEWLQLTLNLDETKSKLSVLTGYQKEFDKVFARYAPLGSDLNKLERDVDVSEKEYLNLLHSLSQAILRKNNLEASENISIVDEAELPLTHNASKRMLLVIVSALSCSVLTIVILILRRFMDHSVASPLNLKKITGLETATAFTVRSLNENVLREMDNRSMLQWSHVLDEVSNKCEPGSLLLLVPFNCSREDAKPIFDKLVFRLNSSERKWNFTGQDITENLSEEELNFSISEIKYPEQFSTRILGRVGKLILVLDASKKLNEYEMMTLEKWKNTNISSKVILINMSEEESAKYLGEIPKERSKFRIRVKKAITRYAK